jgi:MFS transporter, ACS family, hexuronate transporter
MRLRLGALLADGEAGGLHRARKTAMLVCALAVVPILAAATARNLWSALALISLASAAHHAWSANLCFPWPGTCFPSRRSAQW